MKSNSLRFDDEASGPFRKVWGRSLVHKYVEGVSRDRVGMT